MSKIHLRQPGFRYNAYGPFTKNKARIKNFTETGNSQHIYQNELDRACFQQDMTCGDFNYLNGGTASDKVLRDKAFNISKDLRYDRYPNGLNSVVYTFFDKKTSGGAIKKQIMQNQQSAEELHKEIIRKSH